VELFLLLISLRVVSMIVSVSVVYIILTPLSFYSKASQVLMLKKVPSMLNDAPSGRFSNRITASVLDDSGSCSAKIS
jgi:hypothetical protein